MNLKIALYSFAREVFREQADRDYITARNCYRLEFREQFLWASLQACEKYLKGILLFNQKSARFNPTTYDPNKKHNKEFGHDLSALFKAVQGIGDLPIDQAAWLPSFLGYLTKFGNNRYLSTATYALGDELRKLDEAVWVLRRVCQSFDWTPPNEDGSPGQNVRPKWLAQVGDAKHRKNPALDRQMGASGGFLEAVLKLPRSNPPRQALVWNNLFFAKRQRHAVTYSFLSSSENPPQTREWFNIPAITDVIEHYIKL